MVPKDHTVDESSVIETTAIAVRERSGVVLTPVMNLETAKARLREFQDFVAGYLQPSEDGGQDGGDYGMIPGAGKKKVLLKSGADKLCELYGLYDEYEIQAEENFETGLFYYRVKCTLKSRRDDSTVGTGAGSCSTYESKYRWRDSQRKCPQCETQSIIKGQEKFGGGWICWAKKGGCGAKFKEGDKSIEGQAIGRVENPDIFDTINTVLKMAKKRAKVDAVIAVTRSSGIFTQDLEDLPAQQPSKPEPPTTTHDIEIGGNRGPVKGAESQEGAAPAADALVDAVLGAECIGSGEAVNFHKMFRDSLRPELRKEAQELAHEFLKKENIKDVMGKPSALAIKKDNFYDVREKAVQYARAL